MKKQQRGLYLIEVMIVIITAVILACLVFAKPSHDTPCTSKFRQGDIVTLRLGGVPALVIRADCSFDTIKNPAAYSVRVQSMNGYDTVYVKEFEVTEYMPEQK